jgi:hypothetical protein
MLETADGQKFSLTELSDGQMVELMEQAESATIAEAYQAFAITE